jgi:UPF0755 protein
VADRTESEREAARLERERRRASESAGSWAPDTDDGSDPAAFEAEAPADDADAKDGFEDDGLATPVAEAPRREPIASTTRTRGQARPRRSPGARQGAGTGGRWRRQGVVLVVLVAVLAVAWFMFELFQPFHGNGHGSVLVHVPRGASTSEIGDTLARDGVVSSSFFFKLRAKLDGDSSIEAGTYRFPLDTSYGNALRILSMPPPPPTTGYVTITDGLSRAQVDRLLRSQHVRGSYLAHTRRSRLLDPVAYGARRSVHSLEGFLFPDTYEVHSPLRIGQLVADQLTTFKHQFAGVNLGHARAHGLTPYDVLIVASLVQGEASTKRDMRLVAAVIYNRLRLGMELGLDSTTRYATGNYTRPLTVSQLDSPSPWNTRNHTGLPPTPINSPGLTALEAAAHPAGSNDLYFVVKPCGNGEMTFTSSYNQFLADSAAYQNARARRGGNSPEFCKKKK